MVGCAPRRLPDLLAGAPVLAGLKLAAAGGELMVRGRTPLGMWEQKVVVQAAEAGTGAHRKEVDRAIESIGLDFGIATRLTSWVAVSEEKTVDSRQPVRIERIPQELPHGISAEGLGLRQGVESMAQAAFMAGKLHFSRASLRAQLSLHDSLAPTLSGDDDRLDSTHPPTGEPDERAEVPGFAEMPTAPPEREPLKGRWNPVAASILEFVVTGRTLSWKPPASVTLFFNDGSRRELGVAEAATTTAGAVEPDSMVRLALRARREELLGVVLVELRCPEEILQIRL